MSNGEKYLAQLREVERKHKFMNLLTDIWFQNPNQRFNQLMHNLQWEYAEKHQEFKVLLYDKVSYGENEAVYTEIQTNDLFYLDDDNFFEFLEDKLVELHKK